MHLSCHSTAPIPLKGFQIFSHATGFNSDYLLLFFEEALSPVEEVLSHVSNKNRFFLPSSLFKKITE
jgi:hypothetical protein